MFILIMIIILGTCISVLSSLYYNTISLQNTYGSVNTYYWAYYWALSSIERWILMSKIKYPGYVGSWWFIWDRTIWSQSNAFSWNFRKLNNDRNTMIWSVNSLTNNIKWTIDKKTIRAISFLKYTDLHPQEYSNEDITSNVNWLSEWLTFSWNITPAIWTVLDNQDYKIDFYWFFRMTDSKKIVRWLVRAETQQWGNWWYERDNTLWSYFEFWDDNDEYSKDPRPTNESY